MADLVRGPDGAMRVPPTVGAEHLKTYRIAAPPATHWRKATCAEVECSAYLNGWQTKIDLATDLGKAQDHYIRKESGRRFRAERTEDGLWLFTFEPGQRCFGSDRHKIKVGRPELFIVRGGDWRGDPRGERPLIHSGPDDWVDDFATHQDRIAEVHKRG